MRMATERSNNTDFDHACLNPHFYLRTSHIDLLVNVLIATDLSSFCIIGVSIS